MKDFVIYEVGPRDGLQNIPKSVPTAEKITFIRELRAAGLQNIEVTSFAHPKYVPQMADAEEVFDGEGAVLVMNEKGMERALKVNAKKFNIVISPSEEFNKRNLNCNRKHALVRYMNMLEGISKRNVRVYISVAFGCPYEGEISHNDLFRCMQEASLLGDTIVLCDTVGVANYKDIIKAGELGKKLKIRLGLHLHQKENRIQHSLLLVRTALENGYKEIDSSMAGLGGCPFIEGSGGNLPTETLVRWAKVMGYNCGIDSKKLTKALKCALKIKDKYTNQKLSHKSKQKEEVPKLVEL